MTNVQFEEDNQFNSASGFQTRQSFGVPTTPGMVRLLGKLGVHDEKAAGYILVAIAIVAFAASIFILMNVFGARSSQDIIPPGGFPGQESLPGRQP